LKKLILQDLERKAKAATKLATYIRRYNGWCALLDLKFAELKRARKKFAEITGKISQEKSRLQTLNSRVTQGQAKLDALNKKKSKIEEDLSNTKSQLDLLIPQVQDLTSKCTDKKSVLELTKSRNSEPLRILDSAKLAATKSSDNLRKINQDLEQIQKKIKEKREKFEAEKREAELKEQQRIQQEQERKRQEQEKNITRTKS